MKNSRDYIGIGEASGATEIQVRRKSPVPAGACRQNQSFFSFLPVNFLFCKFTIVAMIFIIALGQDHLSSNNDKCTYHVCLCLEAKQSQGSGFRLSAAVLHRESSQLSMLTYSQVPASCYQTGHLPQTLWKRPTYLRKKMNPTSGTFGNIDTYAHT
jgi:hypothetical protein